MLAVCVYVCPEVGTVEVLSHKAALEHGSR
jgi:hypothetical protein